MTATNFPACLNIILASEGGFADLAHDPGGATNHGVTLATWSGWVGHPVTIADMEALTVADVTPLYQADFWNASHCSDLPNGVDLMVFDTAVNAGVGRGVRTLQQALGVTADGAFGPATLAAVQAADPSALIDKIAAVRTAFYESLPTFVHFGKGWLNRVVRTQGLAHQMVSAQP